MTQVDQFRSVCLHLLLVLQYLMGFSECILVSARSRISLRFACLMFAGARNWKNVLTEIWTSNRRSVVHQPEFRFPRFDGHARLFLNASEEYPSIRYHPIGPKIIGPKTHWPEHSLARTFIGPLSHKPENPSPRSPLQIGGTEP